MDFPNELRVILVKGVTKEPLDNVVLRIILHAKEKNDYNVGPYISDSKGTLTIKKSELLHEIKSSKSFYIMDYKSNIKECSDIVTIELLSRDDVDMFLHDYLQLKDICKGSWDYSEYFLKKIKGSRNMEYSFRPMSIDIDLKKVDKSRILNIDLEEKEGVTH